MFNDAPASCFDFWELWFGKLANPHRLDDESCPQEIEHIGIWTWREILFARYGKQNVTKITPDYLYAADVYHVYKGQPMVSDSCAYVDNHIRCNGSCNKNKNV